MRKIVLCNNYLDPVRLNQKFGTNWQALNTPPKSPNAYPVSPLAGPKYLRTPEQYKRWLWGQMQAGNKQILNLLRTVSDDTVFVDRTHKHTKSKAYVIWDAAAWLKESNPTWVDCLANPV